jgi:hypothetical protein
MGSSRKKPAVRVFPPSPLGRATARARALARVSSRADLKPPLSSDPVCRHSIGPSGISRDRPTRPTPSPTQTAAAGKGKAKAAFGTQVAGKSRANAKPHRRQAGHKPKSREQVAFALETARLLASEKRGGRDAGDDPAGPSGRSGTEKEKKKGKENDLVALIANDAAARLAAAEDARAAPRRGGRGFFAAKGKRDASDASLARLDLADEETVRELLGRLPVGHLNERARLTRDLADEYSGWWQLLQSEFSVLLYGFGSKKELLEDFARRTLTDGGVVVVNGFFPGLTAKHILANAAAAVSRENVNALHAGSNDALFQRVAAATRERRSARRRESGGGERLESPTPAMMHRADDAAGDRPSGDGQARSGPRRTARRTSSAGAANANAEKRTDLSLAPLAERGADGDFQPAKRLYIVLHNIDGAQLRSPEAQAVLGELASMPRVHLIASVDHVNAPLLWSKREAARFNWVWRKATTFAPYAVETSFAPQLLASRGEERHIRGAVNVLKSLTSNARDIFRVLAEYQLANPEEKGMGFHAFYTECRSQFLATSEVTLRSHLTEFVDHELTRTRKGSDGEDVVHAPFESDVLAQLLKEIQGV